MSDSSAAIPDVRAGERRRSERRNDSDWFDTDRAAAERAVRAVAQHIRSRAPGVIGDPICHALEAGGKRLRPVLCVSAWRASGGHGNEAAVHALASALELIHTYSLIHDDLPCMDDDALRRGRATAHRVYGVARATVAGAVLIPLACAALDDAARTLHLAADRRQASIQELMRAAGAAGMVGGQHLDLEAERVGSAIDELAALHALKTGALFAAAARIGGMAAGAAAPAVAGLGRYGRELGLAFQIADDVLDETGRAELLGKHAGRDRAQDKATFVRVAGIAAAREAAEAAAERACAALREAGIDDARLRALARYAVERDR